MPAKYVIVTGDDKLDRLMRNLPQKMQTKAIRKATREVAKKMKPKAQALTPSETGAMLRAYQVRAFTKTIKQPTGKIRGDVNKRTGHVYTYPVKKVVAKDYGARLTITRDSLNKQIGKLDGKALGTNDYFYPATVELGNRRRTADMPMRHAKKQMESPAVQMFRAEIRNVLAASRLSV